MRQIYILRWAGVLLALFALTSHSRAGSQPTNAPPGFFVNTNFQKPSQAELQKELTPMQYAVTQLSSTEPAFGNEYWNNRKPGIYADVRHYESA